MKIFLFLFASLFFTNSYAETSNPEQVKQMLIERSYDGDVKAIIELGNKFKLYESVDGLHHFKKWYGIVLESTNGDDVFEFSKIYETYMSKDINGAPRYLQLLKRASDLNNRAAVLELTKYYTYIKKSDHNGYVPHPLIASANVLEHTFFYNKQKYYAKGKDPADQLHVKLMKIGTKKDLENMLNYYYGSINSNNELALNLRIDEIKKALINKAYQSENTKIKVTNIPPVQYYDSNKSFVGKAYSQGFGYQKVSSIIYDYNLNRYTDKLRDNALMTGDVGTALEIANFFPRLDSVSDIKKYQMQVNLYNRLVDQESVLAMLALGEFYDKPPEKFISRNIEQAVYYYTKAANFGSEKALIQLKKIKSKK